MRELASRLDVAEEDIGDALALGTGKPGGEHRVARLENGAEQDRPARKDDGHDRHASLFRRLQDGQVCPRKAQALAVAPHLGVGTLADRDDHRVGPRDARAVGRVRHLSVWPDGLADSGQERRAAAHYVARLALPGDRPAAALNSQVIGRPTRQDQPPGMFRER